jgi:hypothetical protein
MADHLLEPDNLPEGQLDFLQLHLRQVEHFPADLHKRGTPLLLTFDHYDTCSLSCPTFLRFEHFQLSNNPLGVTSAKDLDNLGLLIEVGSTIKSLSLPATLLPSCILPADVAIVRDALLAACAKRKVDVLWRAHCNQFKDDSGVSQEFWAYAKKLDRGYLEAKSRNLEEDA